MPSQIILNIPLNEKISIDIYLSKEISLKHLSQRELEVIFHAIKSIVRSSLDQEENN